MALPKLEQNDFKESFFLSIENKYRLNEKEAVQYFLKDPAINSAQQEGIKTVATKLIQGVRQRKPKSVSIEHFLQTHQLSSQEGLALMCLAEALLRIPDTPTKTQFIREKISTSDWKNQEDDLFFMRLTHFGLLATNKFLNLGVGSSSVVATLASLLRRFGEPVIRQIMAQAMKIMSQQFIMGETSGQALKRSKDYESKGYRYSYDMLGEGARTQKDAARYLEAYQKAIADIGLTLSDFEQDIFVRPSLSVKLSALHPRYEHAQQQRVLEELVPILLDLCQRAQQVGIGLTIDAEESERLVLSLKIIEAVFTHPDLKHWEGLGLAVQAYQKRASFVIDWLISLAEDQQKRISIRLVKGAYWDSEIKRTQERGLSDYAVYTQKVYTDISYLHCAKQLLKATPWVYPQFATHNAYTVAAIYHLAKELEVKDYEFQRLQGMGEALYQQVTEQAEYNIPCRIYAPVGAHKDLLAYLVRRLLENGANSSFVNQIHDPHYSIDSLTLNPFEQAKILGGHSHPKIPLPKDLLLPHRLNSAGVDLSDDSTVKDLQDAIQKVSLPALSQAEGSETYLYRSLDTAQQAFIKWSKTPVEHRAQCLERLAGSLHQNQSRLIAFLVKEAGRTIKDAVAEVREAIDFCYYYANQARFYQSAPLALAGPTGELNQLSYHGRGVFVCISPWNFPLAIFLGQVVAALVTGNTVLAKPAGQTPLVAQFAVELAHKAGIPPQALQLITVPGSHLSETILLDSRLGGVVFTGSTETAHHINRILAQKPGPIVPLIAETGGINAMVVDSSALWEQVVDDVITSAFQSAGQRCSCLRLLLLQHEVADGILEMLKGAMAELRLGDPSLLCHDIGPVIDAAAKKALSDYTLSLEQSPEKATLLYRYEMPDSLKEGNYFPPQIWQLSSVKDLNQEIFGPILHVVRYRSEHLDQVLNELNHKNYALTLGIHTRLETTIQQIYSQARAGNIYVNRNMIGAVVGVQPFGGHGLSGTGPKAGGPNYLVRFMTEVTFTQDITAAGGNASLLASV